MSSEDLHQILIPYLAAGGATALVLLIAAALLKRHGAKQEDEAGGDLEQESRPQRVAPEDG